jgi:precorrin-6Y C5,15-methyltransferase (decarboxylating)
MKPWITIVGIGEDGIEALTPAARALVDSAEVLVGGERHLAMVPAGQAERLQWADGFRPTLDEIATRRGQRIVVLASGDPLFYGAGAVISRHFAAEDFAVIPAPGAFSLAAARLRWPIHECELITVHGRPLATLNLHIAPGVRLLILSWNGDTPAQVAALLKERGYGSSPMVVFENMGGRTEARLDGTAETWNHGRAGDLNTIAVDCQPGADAVAWPRVPGLPEEAFEHDGQITKREVRAATLAALAPLSGQRLWDIGAGSGAVAIEWLRSDRSLSAVAVEQDAERAAAIARNAAKLGVPRLRIVEGTAPDALAELDGPPDAIFVGGGVGDGAILDACWSALPAGGRIVANAVTVEGEAALISFRDMHGGDLTRLSVSRAGPIGEKTAFRPLMDVTQLAAVKT